MDEEIKKQMSSTNKKGTVELTQIKYSMFGSYTTNNMTPMTNVYQYLQNRHEATILTFPSERQYLLTCYSLLYNNAEKVTKKAAQYNYHLAIISSGPYKELNKKYLQLKEEQTRQKERRLQVCLFLYARNLSRNKISLSSMKPNVKDQQPSESDCLKKGTISKPKYKKYKIEMNNCEPNNLEEVHVLRFRRIIQNFEHGVSSQHADEHEVPEWRGH